MTKKHGHEAKHALCEHCLHACDHCAEFPVSQIVALRWHTDPPIPVKFPQLQGV